MALVKDTGIDSVELTNARQIDVGDDSIEDVVEMFMSGLTSIQIVESSNAVEVIKILPD